MDKQPIDLLMLEGEESNLTDWKNPPSVSDLKQDYTDARSAHDAHVNSVGKWLDNLNITGNVKRKKVTGRSSVVPKLIRKQAEWRYASLSEPFLNTDDIFNVDPVTYEDKESSVQNGLILNNQFNTKLNKVRFFDELIRTIVDEGTGVIRVGWDFEEEEQEVEVPDMQAVPVQDPQMAQQLQQVMQMMQQGGGPEMEQVPPELLEAAQLSMQMGQLVMQQQVGSHMEKQMVTLKNQPTVEVCNYENVLIDPTCMGDLNKANFIIYSFETNRSELEKDGKYHNLENIIESESTILDAPDHIVDDESGFNFSDKPRKKFVAYEYWGFWDIDDTGIVKPIVATWVGSTLIRMEENPFPDKKLPFVTIQYLPVRKSIYGEPDGELLEDNQQIVGAVTRGMIDIMGRSANGQIGSKKDALDVTNKRKFDRGQDYEFNTQSDPRTAFHTHVFPEIPKSAEFMLNIQNAEAEALTGIKAFSQGINSQSLGEVATGIKSAMDATAKREMGILRRVAAGVKEVARKLISMNAEFLSEEEVVRITNEDFETVRRDDLAGNFDLRLSISTAEADNEKAKELAFMLQTMGPNSDPNEVRLYRAEIAHLRKMPEFAKKIEDYQPQPDPLEQERKQLEIELLKAQIANETAKANENNANAMLDQAKSGTENAKARNLGSDSDLKDLDFVEQEGGTTQERDLQKMDVGQEANMQGKAFDAEMNAREKARDRAASNTTTSNSRTNV